LPSVIVWKITVHNPTVEIAWHLRNQNGYPLATNGYRAIKFTVLVQRHDEQTNAIELPSMRFGMENQSRQPIDRQRSSYLALRLLINCFFEFDTAKRAILWLVVNGVAIPTQIESHVATGAFAFWNVHPAISNCSRCHDLPPN
jgi:hypothetical protein